MVSLTFFGGVREIGGNKILLEDKDAKVYLDFGQSFKFGEEYFHDWLQPRSAHGLEVYFEFNLIPKIKKLYSKSMLELTDLKYEPSDVDGVIISHSHSDHANHLRFLDENIPIYMGHGTYRVMEIYRNVYPQFSGLGEHKNMRFFKSGDKIKIKHLEIEPIHVDHSVPGAYGFIIKTSKGNLVYTGDLRLHGPQAKMSEEFIMKAKQAKPYALISEGTRMATEQEHNHTEAEVEEKVDKIISASNGLVFTYFSMSNVDRFLSVYRAAIKNKRRMVIDSRFAHILDGLKEKVPALPDVMEDKNLLVYFKRCKSGTYCESDYYNYERKYMPRMIKADEIAKKQKEFVMHMSFNKLMELVYIQPKDADYIYSSSEHFLEGEENEEERKVLENWMEHFGVKFHKAHCSGHASRSDIIRMVKEINPETLIPVHTMDAGDFKGVHTKILAPKKEERIEL
ncbi:MAG: MBL fold metallo-hydrolase [Candidatus Bilamarchaeaceae archaeon]